MSNDLYQQITDKIIRDMEAGTAPWEKPWKNYNGKSVGLPFNVTTGDAYSGMNILLLWMAQIDGEYERGAWLTYKQAQSIGAQVRKGEKGHQVIKVGQFVPKAERAEKGDDARARSFLKGYTVFNIAQCDDVPLGMLNDDEFALPEHEKHAEAERLATGSGARIVNQDPARAFYSSGEDFVNMPPLNAFSDPLDYYRVLFHELTHWTGHKSRCAREFGKRFGDQAYAREELVAELGAAFLAAQCDMTPTTRHASYLESWLRVLKEDKRAIFSAASAASKAATFIVERAKTANFANAA